LGFGGAGFGFSKVAFGNSGGNLSSGIVAIRVGLDNLGVAFGIA
jgi:hypothetical protein